VRYLVLTLGRSDRGPFAAAIDRYRARLDAASGGVELRALKASRLASAAERRAADAETLLSAARSAGHRTVLLDERGASIAAQSSGYESERSIERAGLPPGTYHLRIDRTRGHGGYTMTTRCTP
jgi:23S rRNA pseudoU1915 N3-methylase RlmH